MAILQIYSLAVVLTTWVCLTSGLEVSSVSPIAMSFRHPTVYFFGGGFTPFFAHTFRFQGLTTARTYSCMPFASNLVVCDLTTGPGMFTAGEKGYYTIIIDDLVSVRFLFYVHDETYAISDFGSADGALTSSSTYNVAGGRQLKMTLSGNAFLSLVADVIFESVGLIEGETFRARTTNTTQATDTGDIIFFITTPAWKTPDDWLSSCGDPVVPGGTCAPVLQATMRFSLDLMHYSPPVVIHFGYAKPKLLAFLYPGSTNGFSFTYQVNRGRAQVEFDYGRLVDASNATAGVEEGEFAFTQENFANTSLTDTPVRPLLANGTKNAYYQAFQLMRELCDRNFSVVFTCSIGFHKQTVDASFLPECQSSGTRFVNIGGLTATPTVSVAFAKTYQMRYLTGMIAGADLKERKKEYEQNHGNGTYIRACVGYIAPFPIPQIQRGINAFVLGCKKNFPECTVKVVWTGTFTDVVLQEDAAAFLYNVGECDIITQHTSSIEPLSYFTKRGGSALGYNVDARAIAGDGVLSSTLVSWDVVFRHFIQRSLANTWEPAEDFFPGYIEKSVDLAFYSPKVEPLVRQQVEVEKEKFKTLSGTNEFAAIFCGPLKAKFVYKQMGSNGPVLNNLGNAMWEELAVPRQVNPKHYKTPFNTFLTASDTPGPGDCLWGSSLSDPGEALRADAYPDPFDADKVFSNYLLEGVELFEPVVTDFGTIVGAEAVMSPEGYPSGDRFFQRPVDFPRCDGSQWKRARASCNSVTLTTPIEYSFVTDAEGQAVLCGTEVNNLTGKISVVADLPFIAAADLRAPPCDYVPVDSLLGILNVILITIGVLFMIGLYILYCVYSRERTVVNTQPVLVRAMLSSGLLLCASFALFLVEPSDSICVVRIWMLNLTFDFMFSMLWARVYRLYVIFKYARQFKQVAIRTKEIMLMAVNLTLLDVLILVAWTLTDPPKVRGTALSLDIEDGLESITALECRSESSSFIYVMLFYKFLLIASNCVLVYLLRKVPKQLGELVPYRFVIISAYNTALFVGIVVFLSAVVEDAVTKHTIFTIAGVVGTIIFIGSLACPPLAKGMKKREFLSSSRYFRRKHGLGTSKGSGTSMSLNARLPSSSNTKGSFSYSKTEEEIIVHKL